MLATKIKHVYNEDEPKAWKSRNTICPNTNLEGCELERALGLEYSFFIEPFLWSEFLSVITPGLDK